MTEVQDEALPSVSSHSADKNRLVEIARLSLRLGATAYGGPAAHIAMLQDEVVERRKWVSQQHFLDMLGATNLIPGPNSTEMVIHTGFVRGGWPGLILGGLCFITPAFFSVLALAWAYVEYGSLPAAGWLLYGVKPVVVAMIAQALWKLGKKAVKGALTVLVGVGVLMLYFFNIDQIALLVVGGLLVMLGQNWRRLTAGPVASILPPILGFGLVAQVTETINLGQLFLVFLKIGAVLYGGGYVLLAFLQADLVNDLGWLTEKQLLDAVAIGQITPGPLFTTATFVGYVLGGFPGAVIATIGIFLPSFFFVALSNPIIPRMRKSVWASALLDGVNAAALGLMAAVTIQLGQASLIDSLTIGLTILASILLFRTKINAIWLILGGAMIGLGANSLGLV